MYSSHYPFCLKRKCNLSTTWSSPPGIVNWIRCGDGSTLRQTVHSLWMWTWYSESQVSKYVTTGLVVILWGTFFNVLGHAQLCPIHCDPIDCSPPGSSVHGIFQARILEWVAISFSRGPSQPKYWTRIFMSPALAGRFFTTSTTWEAQVVPTVHVDRL